MHSLPKDGGPAFPHEVVVRDSAGNIQDGAMHAGMTLRDYFAGQALAGMLADPSNCTSVEGIASLAYKFADAMIAARERKEDGQ